VKPVLLLLPVLSLLGCGADRPAEQPAAENVAPPVSAGPDTAVVAPESTPPAPVVSAAEQARQDTTNRLNALIQDHYPHLQVFGFKAGDLNADGRRDMVVEAETACDSSHTYRSRAVLLLLNTGSGRLRIAAVNERGLVGYNSYSGFQFVGRHLQFNSYDGSCQRTYYHVVFRYDRARRDWFLHRRRRIDRDCRNGETEENEETPRHFGRVRFADYTGGEF
jgi:predicted small lipoprotein YifL